MAARTCSWLAVLTLGVLASACGAGPARSPTVPLRIAGGPSNASVTVDDEPIGSFDAVAAHGVALPPGRHRLTVEADGYFPSDQLLDAELGGPPLRLEVQLEEILVESGGATHEGGRARDA